MVYFEGDARDICWLCNVLVIFTVLNSVQDEDFHVRENFHRGPVLLEVCENLFAPISNFLAFIDSVSRCLVVLVWNLRFRSSFTAVLVVLVPTSYLEANFFMYVIGSVENLNLKVLVEVFIPLHVGLPLLDFL